MPSTASCGVLQILEKYCHLLARNEENITFVENIIIASQSHPINRDITRQTSSPSSTPPSLLLTHSYFCKNSIETLTDALSSFGIQLCILSSSVDRVIPDDQPSQ